MDFQFLLIAIQMFIIALMLAIPAYVFMKIVGGLVKTVKKTVHTLK